jgi:hypothetical protein
MNRRPITSAVLLLLAASLAADSDDNPPQKIPLSLQLVGKSQSTKKVGAKEYPYANYTFAISNAGRIPNEWFQPLNILPPESCWNGKPSAARLVLELVWSAWEKPVRKGVCVPILSPKQLSSLEFELAEGIGIASTVQVHLRDRLTGIRHPSNVLLVGDSEVSQTLNTVDCRYFLGRVGEYLCTTDAGFAACTNLKSKARLIDCRRSGH